MTPMQREDVLHHVKAKGRVVQDLADERRELDLFFLREVVLIEHLAHEGKDRGLKTPEVHRHDRLRVQQRRLETVVCEVAVKGCRHVSPFDDLGQVSVHHHARAP